ncbi:Nephrocystin-4 [Lobulomyces angularis]|nr:Nephrocystin-4 [Lobulomyces angularis]
MNDSDAIWKEIFKNECQLTNTRKFEPLGSVVNHRRQSSSPQRPLTQYQSVNNVKCPYELKLEKIEHFPLPSLLTDQKISTMKDLRSQFRISWFDVERASFFGKTWICPVELPLLKEKSEQRFSTASTESLRRESIAKISQKESTPRESTASAGCSEAMDVLFPLRIKNKIKKNNVPLKGSKRISKSKNKRIMSESSILSDSLDSKGGEEDISEEDSFVDSNDDESCHNSEDDEDEDEEEEVSEEQSTEGEEELVKERKDSVTEISNFGKYVSGHKVTAKLRDQAAILHTTSSSPYIIIVIEVVIVSINENFQKELISAGWTFFHPFNLEKNGLDVTSVWNDDSSDNEDFEKTKTLQIFQGTPRVLPFVAPLLMASNQGFPALHPIPGALLNLKFFPRIDLRSVCYLWPETVFVGVGNYIPGLRLETTNDIRHVHMIRSTVSKISISLYPTIRQFEEPLLTKVAKLYYQAHPDSIKLDLDGKPPAAEIIERKIHVGVHNGLNFVHNPFTTTLQPNFDDEIGDGFDLNFDGHLELSKINTDEKGLVVVFCIEYKVRVQKNEPCSPKKTGFSAIFGNKSNDLDMKVVDIDKDVCIGWGFWSPSNGYDTELISVPMKFDSLSPNISGSVVYTPPCTYEDDNDDEEKSLLEFDEYGRPCATKSMPVIISFEFTDNALESGRCSPVLDRALNLTEKSRNLPEQPFPVETVDEALSPIFSEDEEVPEEITPKVEEIEIDEEIKPLPISHDSFGISAKGLSFSKPKLPLSRHERARLVTAGFEEVRDAQGHVVPSVSATDRDSLLIDYELERKDNLKVNSISFLLMGITLKPDIKTIGYPTSVYFTFQFFTFPYVTTSRMDVFTGALPAKSRSEKSKLTRLKNEGQSVNKHSRILSNKPKIVGNSEHMVEEEMLWPGILYDVKDEELDYNCAPGLKISFEIDANDSEIIDYLNENYLNIEVWDGDSMMYLGSSLLQLKTALRQGKPGVSYEEDIEIVMEEISEEHRGRIANSTSHTSGINLLAAGPPASTNLTPSVCGKLHLRVSNIGLLENKWNEKSFVKTADAVIVYDYHYSLKNKPLTFSFPKRMPDVDVELFELLSKTYQKRISERKEESTTVNVNSAVQRKLDRIKRLKDKENLSYMIGDFNKRPIHMYQMTRQERQKDLQNIDIFRERKKIFAVQNLLREQITTKCTITPSFGKACYFEFFFTNPQSKEQNFEIVWDDAELRLVVDAGEWKYLRRIHGVRIGVEEKLITLNPNGNAVLYMMPNETLAIPFVYQSFLSGYNSYGILDEDLIRMQQVNSIPESSIQGRTINVSFINNKKIPVAMLDIKLNPKNYYVSRSLRLFRAENENVRRTLRFSDLPPKQKKVKGEGNSTIFDSANPHKKYLRCNKEDVVCNITEGQNNLKEVSIKFRVAAAPETQAIYYLVYDDPYHTSLSEIWRILVHSLHRIDVNCVMGQTNATNLVLRGSSFTRTVQCYTDHTSELMVMTPSPFLLTANNLNELSMIIRPKNIDTSEMMLNIVDVNQRCIVSSWNIVLHCSPPIVTKSFDISVPRGKLVNKRVSYKNPYSLKKTFYLKTNHAHLLQFKDEMLDMGPGETQYIGLKFTPCTNLPSVSMLIFLNDETDKIEECLSVKVSYY